MPGPKRRNIVKVVTPSPRSPKPESTPVDPEPKTTEPVSAPVASESEPEIPTEPTEPPSSGEPTEPPSERPTEPVSAPVESEPPPPAIRFPRPAPLPTIPIAELHGSEFACSHLHQKPPEEKVPPTVRSQRMMSEPPPPSRHPRANGDPASPPTEPETPKAKDEPPPPPRKAKTGEMVGGVIAVIVIILVVFGWGISTIKGCGGKDEEQTPPPPPTTSAVPAVPGTGHQAPPGERICMPANTQNVARYLYQASTCIKGTLEDPAPDTLSVECAHTPPTLNGCTEIAKCEICLPEGYEAGKRYPLTRKTLRGFTAQGDPTCYVEPADIYCLSASLDALRIDCPGERPYNAVRKCLDLSNCSLIVPPIAR